MWGYFPTAAEYPAGHYELSYSHHNIGLFAQVAPEGQEILAFESHSVGIVG